MRVGVSLPGNWGVPDPMVIAELGIAADKAGFDSVWLGEHVFNSDYIEKRIGDRPYYSWLPLLSLIAGRTEQIKLGTSVVVLPNHHPATLAKDVATLDVLSGGRVILGVACGGNKTEFEEMNLSFAERGEITNEMLEVMLALFTEHRASHHGKRWNFDNVIFSPKPKQQPFPLWVGGLKDSAASMRRTALYGNGWQPIGLTRPEFSAGAAKLRQMVGEAGRDPDAMTMCATVLLDYGHKGTEEVVQSSAIRDQEAGAMVKEIEAWKEAGADILILRLEMADTDFILSEINRIGSEVLPRLSRTTR